MCHTENELRICQIYVFNGRVGEVTPVTGVVKNKWGLNDVEVVKYMCFYVK